MGKREEKWRKQVAERRRQFPTQADVRVQYWLADYIVSLIRDIRRAWKARQAGLYPNRIGGQT